MDKAEARRILYANTNYVTQQYERAFDERVTGVPQPRDFTLYPFVSFYKLRVWLMTKLCAQ